MTAAAPSRWLWTGLAVLGSIGAVLFAVSLAHAHQLFVENGQAGWEAQALAAVVVMLAVGSTIELARRVHMREPIAPAAAALLLGILIEGWGNLATVDAEHQNPAGYFLAGLPTVGTLILLWVFESARQAARARRAARDAEAARERAERDAATARVRAERTAAAEAQRRRVEAQEAAEREAQREAQEAQAAADRAAEELAQAEAQEAQRVAGAAAQAEAQRRVQEAAQRAEADRLRAEEDERRRRSEMPPPPAPGTEAHAVEVALSHRAEHGELPGPTELSRLSETSLATAKRALKKIRETPHLQLVRPTA